ncbi:MAG: ROK family protein [Nitrospinae bacterium]|nr:ROK family protein [Nitrospinota bacterium]
MGSKRRTIGVDLGGTGISFIDMFSPDEVNVRYRIDTPKTRDEIVAALIGTLRGLMEKRDLPKPAGIGVAVAGQVGEKSIVFSPNLPFKTEYPLGEELERALDLPVTIENDANSAAIGERIFGAAQGMDDFIVLTLGTGIGSGIFANGKLLRGHTGAGGEAGHIPLLPGGPLCGCGQKGCLEALASGTAIANAYREKTGKIATAKEVCGLAAQGDAAAQEVLRTAGEWLGAGLVALINLFNPQAVFFTGSLSKAPDIYFEPALKKARESSFGTSGKDVVIEVSKLADAIGVIGAASLPLL